MAVKIKRRDVQVMEFITKAWKTKRAEDLVGYMRGMLVAEKRFGTDKSIADVSFLYAIARIKSPFYVGELDD